MNEIQYGQTVAAQEEYEHWLQKQDQKALDQWEEDRAEKDRQRILRMVNFYDVFSEKGNSSACK